jgi:hypothetical protein
LKPSIRGSNRVSFIRDWIIPSLMTATATDTMSQGS